MSLNLSINDRYFSVLLCAYLWSREEIREYKIQIKNWGKETLQSMYEDIQLIIVNDTIDPQSLYIPKVKNFVLVTNDMYP